LKLYITQTQAKPVAIPPYNINNGKRVDNPECHYRVYPVGV